MFAGNTPTIEEEVCLQPRLTLLPGYLQDVTTAFGGQSYHARRRGLAWRCKPHLTEVHAVNVRDLLAPLDIPRRHKQGFVAAVDSAGVGVAAVVHEGADVHIDGASDL